MSDPFTVERRVEFCETDAAGIAHFSVFFTYMEQAEHAFWRHLGLSVVLKDEGGTISWPRVSASCDYQGTVKFEDVLQIVVRIERLGARSVTYNFSFKRDGSEIANGKVTAVCCRIEPHQPPRSVEIPAWVVDRLRPFVQPDSQQENHESPQQ
jgi:4-hydroxybenzoyl-CoA thioesterase/acyl-CoA thioester hydrolase